IKNPIYGLAVIFADVLVFVIAVCLYVFIDPETLPREVTIFSLMLIGIGSTIYAYTDGENCAKFMVASQIAYVLRVVGLILLVIGWIVGAFSKEDQALRSDPTPRMVTCSAAAELTTLAVPMV